MEGFANALQETVIGKSGVDEEAMTAVIAHYDIGASQAICTIAVREVHILHCDWVDTLREHHLGAFQRTAPGLVIPVKRTHRDLCSNIRSFDNQFHIIILMTLNDMTLNDTTTTALSCIFQLLKK